jgi:formylglycine-generating enzyme
VPGGTYYRSYDGVTLTNKSFPATVSSFNMDIYEVTVGRFRKFVDAGKGTSATAPAADAGANPHYSGTGWKSSWNIQLSNSTSTLKSGLKCDSTYQTWTDTAGGSENEPINCLTWYEAFAFCVWDGGRLATEAEWNYAAAGGSEQRVFPWSVPPQSALHDCTYANYKSGGNFCTSSYTANVGSRSPKGDGRWGQADMGGNVFEWVFDFYTTYITPCTDCANLSHNNSPLYRGGSFSTDETYMYAGTRLYVVPSDRNYFNGTRCVRAP